jgi:hypothetical protein
MSILGRWRFDGCDPGLRKAARANWPHQSLAPVFLHSLGQNQKLPRSNGVSVYLDIVL